MLSAADGGSSEAGAGSGAAAAAPPGKQTPPAVTHHRPTRGRQHPLDSVPEADLGTSAVGRSIACFVGGSGSLRHDAGATSLGAEGGAADGGGGGMQAMQLRFAVLPDDPARAGPRAAVAQDVLCAAFKDSCRGLIVAGMTGGRVNKMHADPKFLKTCRCDVF